MEQLDLARALIARSSQKPDSLERPNTSRRLTAKEVSEVLSESLVAGFSTLAPDGRIHAVPVWFVHASGHIRVISDARSVKFRNAVRSGRASVRVRRKAKDDLRYVSIEGAVSVEPCTPEDRRSLWGRYRDDETADRNAHGDLSRLRVFVVTVESVIARAEQSQ